MNYSKLCTVFESGGLDASQFTHLDHLGVAFEMLKKYDFLQAAAVYADRIKEMAIEADAPDKFNLTITLAFLSLTAERMHNTQYADFTTFIDNNPDLLSGHLMESLYSKKRLYSAQARQLFLLPNL